MHCCPLRGQVCLILPYPSFSPSPQYRRRSGPARDDSDWPSLWPLLSAGGAGSPQHGAGAGPAQLEGASRPERPGQAEQEGDQEAGGHQWWGTERPLHLALESKGLVRNYPKEIVWQLVNGMKMVVGHEREKLGLPYVDTSSEVIRLRHNTVIL